VAAYTAVIGDARSVGALAGSQTIPTNAALPRLNPQLATARIRNVLNPHIVSDAVGGLLGADFTIPAEEAIRWRPLLRYGVVVWLFDGSTPLFQGYAEQPVWTATGDCQMTVSGPWVILQRARMREAWDLWDLSQYTRGVGAAENKAGQVNITADGAVTFSFPNGTVVATSDRVSINYTLFGEAAGVADSKFITAFEFDITAVQGLSAARRFRVRGQDTPTTGAADLLYDTISTGSSGVQGALNLNGTNQGAAAWPSARGYRCVVFQMVFTTGSTLSTQDVFVTLDRIRVSSRESLFQTVSGGVVNPLDTAAVARDVLTIKPPFSAASTTPYGNWGIDIPLEFFPSSENAGAPDSNTYTYGFGRDPVTGTGTAPNSGVGTTGFNALEWQSPADILTALAAIDGSHVGFYLPYNGRGGYDPAGANNPSGFTATDVGSFWLTAPPQLFYQAFTDPTTNPDYTVQTQEGAQVVPTTDVQPLVDYLYANYQTIKGRQQSVVVQDVSQKNYVFSQGYRRVEDYTIQPSVGDNQTPTSQAAQYLAQRRLPTASAVITITNDGASRYAILKQGCVIARLATIRPGSLQINGVATSGLNLSAGYATHVEWWGESDTGPEYVELTLAQPPGQISRETAHGRLAYRSLKTRHRILF